MIAILTGVRYWNQPKYPAVIDWIKKMWHIYAIEYYATIKQNEFMSFAGTWMKLETIILSKLTQEQNTKHCMFSLISGSLTMRTHGHREEKTHTGACCGWGTRGGRALEQIANACGAQNLGDVMIGAGNYHGTLIAM